MSKGINISFTTIVTLFILVFTEAAHNILRGFHFRELNLLMTTLLLGGVLLILSQTLPKKYRQIGRLSAILCFALSVETFANWVLGEFGRWPTLITSLAIIYSLAWYGYIETHKLKAL